MRCRHCGREARVFVPHIDAILCDRCFITVIRKRIEEEIDRYKMIDRNDIILMGISGGKDSYVLMDVLSQIHDPTRLIALTIIEGIPAYNRSEELEFAKKSSKERGVEHIVVSFKDAIGHSLEELVTLTRLKGLDISPCTFCGTIRRRILNIYARELGATKTATAHNLDDEVQTIIINLMRGDIMRLLRQHPLSPLLSERFIKRVKPLRKIYEWEIVNYANFIGYRFQDVECPYITFHPTVRARVRRWMLMLERERPGAILNLLNRLDAFAEIYYSKRETDSLRLKECKICGEPTTPRREYCKVCELLMKLDVLASK